MSEDEGPAEPGTPPPPATPAGPPPGAPFGGPPPSARRPHLGQGAPPPAFSVQLPSIDVQALAKTPWVLGAAAILMGLVLYWAGSVLSAFQHDVGYDARQRIIHLLGPGDAEWAVSVLLAVALLVLGSSGEAKRAPMANFLYQLLLLAAALITVASVINAVIDSHLHRQQFRCVDLRLPRVPGRGAHRWSCRALGLACQPHGAAGAEGEIGRPRPPKTRAAPTAPRLSASIRS